MVRSQTNEFCTEELSFATQVSLRFAWKRNATNGIGDKISYVKYMHPCKGVVIIILKYLVFVQEITFYLLITPVKIYINICYDVGEKISYEHAPL